MDSNKIIFVSIDFTDRRHNVTIRRKNELDYRKYKAGYKSLERLANACRHSNGDFCGYGDGWAWTSNNPHVIPSWED